MKLKGRAWVTGNDIDTDQIYHGQYLPITDPHEMAKHAMEYVPGMENFPREAKSGDMVVAGKNFGTGSSREHAVLCLQYLGISCVVAKSFSRIFFRNAVNLGFPVIECPLLSETLKTGNTVEVDVVSGKITDLTTGESFRGTPPSGLEKEIAGSGGLIEYLKKGARGLK